MIPEIRMLLHAQPFVPFSIRVADGREYHVPTADHAHVLPKGTRVIVYTDEGRQFVLPGLLLSGVESDTPDSVHENEN